MAEATPYAPEMNTIKGHRNYKEYPIKANGISFSAFLLSIFIYISIFYIFDLSPSSLLNTTKFWFLISNTLILIIAADSGAFSSSKQSQDNYLCEDHYIIHNTMPVHVEDSEKKSKIIVPDNKMYSCKQSTEDLYKECVLHTASIVMPIQEVEEQYSENKLEIVVIKSDPEKPSNNDIQETMRIETALEEEHVDDQNMKHSEGVCWSETDQEYEASCILEENNEFSSMTNEELNMRVEEFIQKFNR